MRTSSDDNSWKIKEDPVPDGLVEDKIFEGERIFDRKIITFHYPGIFPEDGIKTVCFKSLSGPCQNHSIAWKFDHRKGNFRYSVCVKCGAKPGLKNQGITLGRINTYVRVDEFGNKQKAGDTAGFVCMREKNNFTDSDKSGALTVGATTDDNHNITYFVVHSNTVKEVKT
uniref:Uncharacterized protein n=1 Tax=Leptocylindrus danicus TaxID=163516 RepID=A0A7S2PKI7_9STRA|mmetsp:Transcript_3845/g.5571  ORF Transcript_3845/g.5571 Transcript_3845/m.5571 type:complete len:170 (+) Transcript_3845:118-627(+)